MRLNGIRSHIVVRGGALRSSDPRLLLHRWILRRIAFLVLFPKFEFLLGVLIWLRGIIVHTLLRWGRCDGSVRWPLWRGYCRRILLGNPGRLIVTVSRHRLLFVVFKLLRFGSLTSLRQIFIHTIRYMSSKFSREILKVSIIFNYLCQIHRASYCCMAKSA